MSSIKAFQNEVAENIKRQGADKELKAKTLDYLKSLGGYAYNFSWMGRPIIQLPQDIYAMQELIWNIKPDLIIETGIAHGGSLIFYASILEMIGKGEVVGIDIEIKKNNPKTALEKFLQENDRFIIDKSFNEKLLITANQDGYLKCIKDLK